MPVQVCWRFYAFMLIGVFGTIISIYYLLVLRDKCRKFWKKSDSNQRITIDTISASVITNDLTSAVSFGQLTELTEYEMPPSYEKIDHNRKLKNAKETIPTKDVKIDLNDVQYVTTKNN